MMHKSPAIKMLALATWVITALASINILTAAYGYDGAGWIVEAMPGMAMLLVWIIGLSGIVSLGLFVKCAFVCCPGCGSSTCSCNEINNMNNMNKM